MIDIVAHTMEYTGSPVESFDVLKNYSDSYFEEYKRIYEACFHEMRQALELNPIDACDSRDELMKKSGDIFLYTENNTLIGSVAIYNNEIDDLIVAKEHQHKGCGQLLLRFAIAHIQKMHLSPIVLHVADWNRQAINLYLKSGFIITKTETVKRTV